MDILIGYAEFHTIKDLLKDYIKRFYGISMDFNYTYLKRSKKLPGLFTSKVESILSTIELTPTQNIFGINHIYAFPLKGESTSVDTLIWEVEDAESFNFDFDLVASSPKDYVPTAAYEVTKYFFKNTNSDKYERLSKFIELDRIYGKNKIKKYMVYLHENRKAIVNLEVVDSTLLSLMMHKTLGIEILGFDIIGEIPCFKSPFEIIDFFDKKAVNDKEYLVNKNFHPYKLDFINDEIVITAEVTKKNHRTSPCETPAIGFVEGVSTILREVGYNGRIIINTPKLEVEKASAFGSSFYYLCKYMDVDIKGYYGPIDLSGVQFPEIYCMQDKYSEKLGQNLVHSKLSEKDNCQTIFTNFGGSEKSDVRKVDNSSYRSYKKMGRLPDSVVIDTKRNEMIMEEAKIEECIPEGIKKFKSHELDTFADSLKENDPKLKSARIVQTVPYYIKKKSKYRYGATDSSEIPYEKYLSYGYSYEGVFIVHKDCPELFKEVIQEITDEAKVV